jgi:3'-phosphoadenosine 5'-phosphosulfate sulfotransferase (PAPS reductase)/FAD synthetase
VSFEPCSGCGIYHSVNDCRWWRGQVGIEAALEGENPVEMFGLFSGGHDSLCSTHLAAQHPRFTGVIHINTGIGIEETREFVREVCAERSWKLFELHSDVVYEDLVLNRGGFPGGPKAHNSMYWFLKEKPLRAFVQSRKQERRDRIGLVTGIRRQESERRMAADMAKPVYRTGAYLWLNPILNWSVQDKARYMARHGLPRNEVSDLLHRSGECLCGALARREELKDIVAWYPEVGQRILDLEQRCKEAGLSDRFWASRRPVSPDQGELFAQPMCVGCADVV